MSEERTELVVHGERGLGPAVAVVALHLAFQKAGLKTAALGDPAVLVPGGPLAVGLSVQQGLPAQDLPLLA